MKLSLKLLIYGIAAAIVALFWTCHERIGAAIFFAALIPTYYLFFKAAKHLYDD